MDDKFGSVDRDGWKIREELRDGHVPANPRSPTLPRETPNNCEELVENSVVDEDLVQNGVMDGKFVKKFVMDAKIDPKVVMDLSIFKIGGWNSLQPIDHNLFEEFVDKNEPWLLIGIPIRDPFFVTQYLERHSVR